MRIRLIIALARTACLALLLVGHVAQSQEQPAASSSKREDSLKKFLQGYVGHDSLDNEQPSRYADAFVDLNGDGKNEAIVYLVGRRWCGSGGCRTLVLTPVASSYRVIANIMITNPPIRVLTRSSHGWRSLSVWVRGGGILPGEVELPFDGKKYPISPSMPNARRLKEGTTGDVLIPDYTYGKGDNPLFSNGP